MSKKFIVLLASMFLMPMACSLISQSVERDRADKEQARQAKLTATERASIPVLKKIADEQGMCKLTLHEQEIVFGQASDLCKPIMSDEAWDAFQREARESHERAELARKSYELSKKILEDRCRNAPPEVRQYC